MISKITAIVASLILSASVNFASAQNYSSTYTKLDFDKHCTVFDEYELGVSAKCTGYQDYPIYFSEGDLRVMVRFGHTSPKTEQWESFGQFNNVGQTVEWRLSTGYPVAAILRWYVDGINDQTGNPEQGQVLVVSTVATRAMPQNACVVGYVDARANSNANVMARNVADTIATNFKCGVDKPKYYGKRGPYAGSPTSFSG